MSIGQEVAHADLFGGDDEKSEAVLFWAATECAVREPVVMAEMVLHWARILDCPCVSDWGLTGMSKRAFVWKVRTWTDRHVDPSPGYTPAEALAAVRAAVLRNLGGT